MYKKLSQSSKKQLPYDCVKAITIALENCHNFISHRNKRIYLHLPIVTTRLESTLQFDFSFLKEKVGVRFFLSLGRVNETHYARDRYTSCYIYIRITASFKMKKQLNLFNHENNQIYLFLRHLRLSVLLIDVVILVYLNLN